ncbi:MAG: thioesterase family protein [Holophagales bacterium]|nr:thioesterase family protein [Holophagales bacterium]
MPQPKTPPSDPGSEPTVPASFYLVDGDHFVSTVLTRGPWDRGFQHGGPPSALLATALLGGVEGMSLARITLEFLRPVPIAPLRIEVAEVTEGRRVRRRRARLFAEDRTVMEAVALFVRDQPGEGERFGDPWPEPDEHAPFLFPFFPWDVGYQAAVDVRLLDPPWGRTPMRCWARARVPLVAGQDTRPEAHVLILADAESGMGPPVDPLRWTYLNPDLTVYFARRPAAGWLGLDIRSFAGDTGGGLSEARLRDARGVFGRSAQSLVVQERPG